jgi:N-acetyl-gamma-glutamylphosphate reductase
VQFYVFREVVQLIIYNIYDHKHLQEIMNKYYNKVCIFLFFFISFQLYFGAKHLFLTLYNYLNKC